MENTERAKSGRSITSSVGLDRQIAAVKLQMKKHQSAGCEKCEDGVVCFEPCQIYCLCPRGRARKKEDKHTTASVARQPLARSVVSASKRAKKLIADATSALQATPATTEETNKDLYSARNVASTYSTWFSEHAEELIAARTRKIDGAIRGEDIDLLVKEGYKLPKLEKAIKFLQEYTSQQALQIMEAVLLTQTVLNQLPNAKTEPYKKKMDELSELIKRLEVLQGSEKTKDIIQEGWDKLMKAQDLSAELAELCKGRRRRVAERLLHYENFYSSGAEGHPRYYN